MLEICLETMFRAKFSRRGHRHTPHLETHAQNVTIVTWCAGVHLTASAGEATSAAHEKRALMQSVGGLTPLERAQGAAGGRGAIFLTTAILAFQVTHICHYRGYRVFAENVLQSARSLPRHVDLFRVRPLRTPPSRGPRAARGDHARQGQIRVLSIERTARPTRNGLCGAAPGRW